MKLKDKKGAIEMSFGVIFSIILIAVFIFAAIYGIRFFLQSSKSIQIKNFYEGFQTKVRDVRLSSRTDSEPFPISLPNDIKRVCFANLSATITNKGAEYQNIMETSGFEEHNVFLVPGESISGFASVEIKGLNIEKIIGRRNPYCVDSSDTLLLSKGIYESSVDVVSKVE